MTQPNPDEFKRALHLVDVAMLCVSNTPLTANNHDGIKACLAWLSEMKGGIGQQLQDVLQDGFIRQEGCDHGQQAEA